MSLPNNLPLSPTLILENGTYGTIIKLHTNKFSSADLDAFTARPELVLAWSAGTATIPSAIVKGAKDVVYNANGMALPVVLLPTDRSTPIKSIAGTNNTITYANDIWTCHMESTTGQQWMPFFRYTTLFKADEVYKITATIIVSSGKAKITGVEYGLPDGTAITESINKTLSIGTYTFIVVGNKRDNGNVNVSFDGQAEHNTDFTVKLDMEKITSPTLPLTGTHTTTNTSQFGIQQIKVGSGAMNGKDDGRYIDIPMVGGHKHMLKTCVKLIAGDITNVTETPC